MRKRLLFCALVLLAGFSSRAQQLVYRPLNPAFGGNTFNYQWMLSGATAQDTYKDPASQTTGQGGSLGRQSTTPLEDFSTNLQRQILNRISRDLLDSQFGENGLQEGTFQYGDLQVTVSNAAEGVLIRIVDGSGGETTITVPYF
ncbi:curli production assembly/transport component CsgF [Tellurirhabdus rosea]|uniref:curli production assembly/transport component CsgF n=1 Tax=Tellurirhabdus rosea TaxID=2674997 RepID=UPI002253AB04|nr:curli production assembly/transport component CsgF [Tellurirhabdus rosea]